MRGRSVWDQHVLGRRWPNESEVLFPPGVAFRIAERYTRGEGDFNVTESVIPALKRLCLDLYSTIFEFNQGSVSKVGLKKMIMNKIPEIVS